MDRLRICPECGREYNTFPAVSRRDDVTEICPECGAREAIEAAQLDLETAAEILQALRNAQEAGV